MSALVAARQWHAGLVLMLHAPCFLVWTLFLRPLVPGCYLFSVGLPEECVCGFFWETTSGFVSEFSAFWLHDKSALRQWHVQGWFYWLCSSRCVPSSCRQAKVLGISAGMDLRDSCAALVVVAALVVYGWLLSRCILFGCRQARVAGHHGVPGQGCSLPVCATTRLMVQTVQMYVFVQFLDKVGDSPAAPVESPQVSSSTRLWSFRQVPWSRQ